MTEISTQEGETVGVGRPATTNGAPVYSGQRAEPRVNADASGSAVLDSAHVGDISGAFGETPPGRGVDAGCGCGCG
jgi:hypothetical protein